MPRSLPSPFFFFNDTATTEIYTLSLHDALPIYIRAHLAAPHTTGSLARRAAMSPRTLQREFAVATGQAPYERSEEHTSELQSRSDLVCRLLLEKKKKTQHREATPQTARFDGKEH